MVQDSPNCQPDQDGSGAYPGPDELERCCAMQKEEGCVRNKKVYQASLGALEKTMVLPDSDIIEAQIIGTPPVGYLGCRNGHRKSSLGSDGDNHVCACATAVNRGDTDPTFPQSPTTNTTRISALLCQRINLLSHLLQ